MQKFDAYLFDLDGTLLDSLGMWSGLDGVFLAKRGLSAGPDYTAAVSAMSFEGAAAYTVGRFGLAETPEQLVREWESLAETAYRESIPLKPGAEGFLRRAKASGGKLAVATALPPRLYGPVLTRNGVFGLFDAFASVGEVKRGKGFPDVYLLAAERLGVQPARCAVFEDVLPGIRGAKAAGMTAVGFYDAASAPDEARIRAEADMYLEAWPSGEEKWEKQEVAKQDVRF